MGVKESQCVKNAKSQGVSHQNAKVENKLAINQKIEIFIKTDKNQQK